MPRFASWLGLSGLIIVFDQLTKFWVVSALRLGQSIELTSFLNLVFVYNPGAAFSFLSDAGGWQRWFFVVLAIAVSGWLTFLIRQHAAERLLPLAAALIMGGALGNVIDRIRFGAVVDFVIFTPRYNIGIRIQSFYYHIAASQEKQVSDYEQRMALERYGLRIVDVYEQDYIHDLTGNAARRLVRMALAGEEMPNPRAYGIVREL